MSDRKKPKRSFSVAATITLVYFTAGLLWVYFSDLFLLTVTRDEVVVSQFQTYKGWFFILTSAGLLYFLTRVLIGKIIRAHERTALAYQATIDSLLSAIELRDIGTGTHSQRVVSLALKLGQEMGLTEGNMEVLRKGGLLHDIGKIGIPDNILRKPGNLTLKEWKVMRTHAQRGYELMYSVSNLKPAAVIALCHHERWDGSGYPRGLKGKAIPLEARLFAVVDVWDALISPRLYRRAWSKEKAFGYIVENSGKLFDPAVVEAFVRLKQNGFTQGLVFPNTPFFTFSPGDSLNPRPETR